MELKLTEEQQKRFAELYLKADRCFKAYEKANIELDQATQEFETFMNTITREQVK